MSAAKPPFISILIPAYNRPDFLCLAIRSILKGAFSDFEILISEDRSPRQDTVLERLQEFASEPRVRWFAQSVNLGWSKNRNFLVSKAQGQFVWLMGDDDMLPVDALTRLHAFITRRPRHDIYAFGYEVIDEVGTKQYERRAGREMILDWQDRFTERQLFISHVVPFWLWHPFTFCYKRELGSRFPYVPDAFIGDDILFLFECAREHKTIAVTPEILFQWRKFSATASSNGQAQVNLSSALNGIKARAKILELMEKDPSWKQHIARLFSAGEYVERFLFDSLRADSGGTHDALLSSVRGDLALAARFESYRNPYPRMAMARVRIGMIYSYLRLTGLGGVIQLFRRTFQSVRR